MGEEYWLWSWPTDSEAFWMFINEPLELPFIANDGAKRRVLGLEGGTFREKKLSWPLAQEFSFLYALAS